MLSIITCDDAVDKAVHPDARVAGSILRVIRNHLVIMEWFVRVVIQAKIKICYISELSILSFKMKTGFGKQEFKYISFFLYYR